MNTTNVPTTASVSYFARVSALIFTLLIIYASLYPFTGWRDMGVHPFSYLTDKLPYYRTYFDIWTNIVGYMPLGMLMIFALYPNLKSYKAFLLTCLFGILLSGSMEAIQTYIPTRVPSILDLMTNACGTLLGAIIGLWTRTYFLKEGFFIHLREKWFISSASRGLVVVGLWPLALIYPQNHVFGLGHFFPLFSDWFSTSFDTPLDLTTLWINTFQLRPEAYWLADIIITVSGLTSAVLMLFILLKRQAPRIRIVISFIMIMVAVKTLSCALLFEPQNDLIWATSGTIAGGILSIPILVGLSFAPQVIKKKMAIVSLLLGLIVVNFVPDNPYFIETLQTWTQGNFLNFNGAAQFLAILLPFLALWYLFHPVHKKQVKQDSSKHS